MKIGDEDSPINPGSIFPEPATLWHSVLIFGNRYPHARDARATSRQKSNSVSLVLNGVFLEFAIERFPPEP